MNRATAIAGVAGTLTCLPHGVRAASDTIRLGIVAGVSSSEVYTGLSEGFFSRAGLDVQLQTFANGAAISSGILGGSLDIGGTNIFSLATAHEKGLPLKIVAAGSVYTTQLATTELLVAKQSSLRTARDLNGTTLAVNGLKGIAHISALAWIDKNGGDSRQVKFIEMPFSAMPPAIEATRIDGAVFPEPFITQSKDQTRVLGKSYDGIADRWLIDAYVATETWISANRDAVRRFNLSMRQAGAWVNRHTDQTAEIVSKAMGTDLALVKSMVRATFPERYDLALVQPIIDAGAKYGGLNARFLAADLFSAEASR